MARISKDYEERLKELLDAAQQLFFEKGYEKVSVNHIIKKVGVAKGTFYHYFKTKEDLLDKLVARFSDQMLIEVEKLVARDDLDALQKLNGVFASSRAIKGDNVQLMMMLLKALYNENNLRLRHKIIRARIDMITSPFSKIISQGVDEGLFDVKHPTETAEMIFHLNVNFNDSIGELILKIENEPTCFELIYRKVETYEYSIEKILGLPPNSLNVANREYLKKFIPDNDSGTGK
ncbi:MAG: TetR/AcrR family transcriptional regulator [bacterium]|nr:TetR/AcrR family transcriptional regulator [bacterium]